MNTTTQIYRGIEDIVTPESERDEVVESVIENLEEFDFDKAIHIDHLDYKRLIKYKPTLNSRQILSVSNYMKNLPKSPAKMNYLSKLIQTSYIAGNNNFIIDNNQESYIANTLIGTKNNDLKLRILNDAGDFFGCGSSHCNIIMEGNVKHTGLFVKNCFLEILQDLDYLASDNNVSSKYKVHGKIRDISRFNFSNVTLILNPEQYKKWKPIQNECDGLSIELMKE